MDVKQEPFDMHVKFKNEPDEVVEPQTRGQFLDVQIKEETIKCEVPKTEKLPDLPINIDYDTVDENIKFISTIKKELEDINDFREVKASDLFVDISDIKREIGEDVHVKIESELLATHCDLPTLKDEGTDYTNYFAQPCSSKQSQRPLQPLKNRTSKVARKKKRLYPCPVCQKKFVSSKPRSKHIDRHFGKRFLVCKFCGKHMNRIEFFQHYPIYLVKNRTRKASQNITEFSNLDKDDTDSNKLNSLNKSCIKGQPLKCDLFSKELKQKWLSMNIKIQSNVKSLECEEYKRKTDLHKNSITNSDNKRFKCETCFRTYALEGYLRNHLKSCSKELKKNYLPKKSFKCDLCSKIYTTKYNLQIHLKKCSNTIDKDYLPKKKFKCGICFNQYTTKYSLFDHLRPRLDGKPFNCSFCSKIFEHRCELKIHLKKCSNTINKDYLPKKKFKCGICFNKFTTKYTLFDHLRPRLDGKPFNCSFCSKIFEHRCELKIHLKKCSNTINKDYLPKKKFKCGICFNKFITKYTLFDHLRPRLDGKPFNCSFCSKIFEHRCELKIHLKIHKKV